MIAIFCRINGLFRTILLMLFVAAVGSAEAAPRSTVFKGTVTHAPSKGVVLFYGNDRQKADLDASGNFSCSLELQAPAYAEMEFEFRKGKRLIVFLLPGRTLSLDCDAQDIFGTARFSGGGAPENNGLVLLQVRYDRVDYGRLAEMSPSNFLEVVRSYQKQLENVLADYTGDHAGLDPWFQRMERALHGAGWAAGMPEWGYPQCRHFAEKGLAGISFEYRVRWRHGTTPLECIEDAKSAVRWVRAHAGELGVDPKRIAVAGFSAGGHLAAATGLIADHDDAGDDKSVSAVPNAMILISAAMDAATDSWFLECLAGRADPAECTPARHVRPGLPPTVVFHGLEDPLCPFPRTEAFYKNMRDAGNRCELHTFKGRHFRSQADWAVIYEKMDEFLASLGFLGPF